MLKPFLRVFIFVLNYVIKSGGIMIRDYRDFHVVTTIILNLVLMILTMASNNPVVLLGAGIICLTVIVSSGNAGDLKRGLIYFIPFSIVTMIINMLFSWEGKIILFYIFNKKFTLEALVFALILSIKLLIVIYIFRMLSIMIDSDRAVSYFSAKLPKSTLTLMIGFKLFPNMRIRLGNIKEVYSIRGVDFEGKKLKDRLKGYIPVMTILLESSLEGAFDIGEAAYIRGFLSGKRSIYDKQKFRFPDYAALTLSAVLVMAFLVFKTLSLDSFEIYQGFENIIVLNYGVMTLLLLCAVISVLLLKLSKEK